MRDLLAFPDTSRVWIYQADKPMPEGEIGALNERIVDFAQEWTSHNKQLKATGGLLHDRFLVLVADESQAGASGCSIDTSVRFVKQVGQEYNADFFDRMQFAYLKDDAVKTLHRDDLDEAYKSKEIDDETLFFDNLVSNKSDFLARWVTPLGKSWMKRFIQQP